MRTTSISSCTCSHEFQDRVYGRGKRLHNVMHGSNANQKTNPSQSVKGYRCTVCGDEKRT